MKCPVVVLEEWKAAHRPVISIFEVHNRAVINWWLEWWKLWLR